MNLNLPSDIEKKVDHVIISLPFKDLTLRNLLKNTFPGAEAFMLSGKSQKFRIRPGDSDIDFNQRSSKAGIYWNFRFNFDLADNNKNNFNILNRFTNRKVVLLIGTTQYIYQVGFKEQALDFLFKETLSGFRITVEGDIYFPAARKTLVSFRSAF